MSDFDLRALVRQRIEMTTETEPGRIAADVAADVPPEHYLDALTTALVPLVREILGQGRMASRRTGESSPRPRNSPHPVRSAKVTAIRQEMWKRRLRDNIWVGAEGTERKFLADCTVGDLDRAIALRRGMAAANLVVADELAVVRDALDTDEKAKVVADLPERVLAVLLNKEMAA